MEIKELHFALNLPDRSLIADRRTAAGSGGQGFPQCFIADVPSVSRNNECPRLHENEMITFLIKHSIGHSGKITNGATSRGKGHVFNELDSYLNHHLVNNKYNK